MDRRERKNDLTVLLRSAINAKLVDVWTALPGIVSGYDATKMTVKVRPAIQAKQQNEKGEWSDLTLTECLDVPVQFPSGGGFAMTFPIAVGDEGIIIFSARCIDGWWQSGDVSPQAELRMHDPSDGMFIPGIFSQPRKLSDISTTKVQLRSTDGHTRMDFESGNVQITPDNGTTIFEVVAGKVKVTGNLEVTGNINWSQGSFASGVFAFQGEVRVTGQVFGLYGTASQVGLVTHSHTSGVPGNQTSGPTAGT